MLGSLGTAILLASLLVLATVVGPYVLAYAAHCFLIVLEQTAAGGRHVDWPDEPFLDWIWKAFYLLWLTAVWLVPISLLVRALDLPLLPGLLLAGGLFALVFPVGLLSSLGGSSKLVILSPTVLGRLARMVPRLAAFYLVTGLILAGCGVVLGFGLAGWQAFRDAAAGAGPGWLGTLLDVWAWLVVLPVTALVVAVAALTYARLLGRVGFLLNQVRVAEEAEDDDDENEEVPAPSEAKPVPVAAPAVKPAAPPAGEVFGLLEDATPSPPMLYEVPQPRPPRRPEAQREPDEPGGPLPPLLAPGTFGFLGQRATWGVLTWLTLGGSVLAAVLRLEILLWPF
jgi:hypothetical protein